MKIQLALTVLLFAQGCATLQSAKVACYVPRDESPKESRAQMDSEFAECSKTALTPRQHGACMFQKGYALDACYEDTNQPVNPPAHFIPRTKETPSKKFVPALQQVSNPLTLK